MKIPYILNPKKFCEVDYTDMGNQIRIGFETSKFTIDGKIFMNHFSKKNGKSSAHARYSSDAEFLKKLGLNLYQSRDA